MSNRITRNNLFAALDTLNKMMERKHRPTYALSMWSPGDGWTRYRLTSADQSHEISHSCTLREIYEVIYCLIRVIERL